MINLRYHIVSITAVFLALGIGLAFGAAFIDRATVDALNRNLTDIENQNRDLEETNDRLRERVNAAEDVEDALLEQGIAQLVDGHLDGVPVLVMAPDDLDDDVVARIAGTVVAAGAESGGTLRVTDRIALDDDSEVDDLREILGLPDAPPGQLRTAVVRQLRAVLHDATAPDPALDDPATEPDPPAPVPGIVQALLDGGFLELDPLDPNVSLIPARGLRLVIVVGHDAPEASEGLLLPLAEALAAPSPTAPDEPPRPVLVAEPRVPQPDGDEAPIEPYVSGLRDDDVVGPRLVTVDGVDTFAGLAAVVLGVEAAGEGRLGHFGTLDDAQRLLPAPVL